jgi:DNA (cytosine-5)-methyltransferase 1
MKNEIAEVMQVGNIMQEKNFSNPQCGRIYSTHGLSPTINTCGGGQREPKIINDMADQNAIKLPSELKGKKFRIRKLTPKECFRLMGVNDADIDKIQAAGISNSGQYKLAGNSIVVDVLYHIFRKMFIETDVDKNKEPQQLSLF